jgi:hypothetical protein
LVVRTFRRLLAHPVVARHLDLDRPLAVIQSDTLHYVPAADGPSAIVRAYVDALAPGSYLALTHLLAPERGSPHGAVVGRLGDNLRSAVGWVKCRPRHEIEAFLDGLTLVEPGLVPVGEWRPTGPRGGRVAAVQQFVVGAVGRKP